MGKEKIPELVEKGHKILLFSQWTKILDMLEYMIQGHLRYNTSRLDGQVAQQFRQDIIDHFNTCTPFIPANAEASSNDNNMIELDSSSEAEKDYEKNNGKKESNLVPNPEYTPIFLLSTGAGGVGINLTAADIVILHDVGWNPEIDRQAEDRTYRIGQTRNVHVYKLVTKDTVDEDIFKCGLRKTEYNQRLLERRKASGQAASDDEEDVKDEDEEKEEDVIQRIINEAIH